MTDTTQLKDNRTDATFSDDGTYRYRLRRSWDVTKPSVAFVMLNPSTADASNDDPTIRRCRGYATDWGFGELVVGNIFSLRSSEPDDLYDHPDPVGPRTDTELERICTNAALIVAAWGAHGSYQNRGPAVAQMLTDSGHDLTCLDTTKEGHPGHPLYQPADATPQPFSYGGDVGGD